MLKEEILPKLKGFAIFQQVPEEQLSWLIDKSEVLKLEEGHPIFRPGEPIDKVMIVLEGEFRIYAISGNHEREIAQKTAGEVSGFLPFSRAKQASGNGRVIQSATILALHKSYEREMLRDHYELSQVLVHEMTSRVREMTTIQKQTEKMAALGKLSAGLAHEMNNPAAAIVRSSMELKKQLGLQPEKFKKVIKIKLSDVMVDQINDILFEKLRQSTPPKSLLERKEIEDDIGFMLEDMGVEQPFELAENLVEFGFEASDIEQLAGFISKEDVSPVLHWIGDNLLIEKMVQDIQDASMRISELVNSVKMYTHMDQSPEKMQTDLHQGIENTLKILNHKIKNNKVTVQLDFDESVPKMLLYVSEMNQVWTNLLDNAIDAVAELAHPEIRITTRRAGSEVKVTITDNGGGISEELIARIWEPFFTTKDMGKGTGLGLELVANIVEKHNANIKVKSQPGNTTFELCFPLTT